MNFFQNMISSIMENGLSLSRFRAQGFGTLHKNINQATESVMHTSGEVSSIAFAEHLLDLIEDQSAEDLVVYLKYLLSEYDVDTEVVVKVAEEYSINKNQKNLQELSNAAEPKWIELFRRLNATPNGTHRLIELREQIRLHLKQGNSQLKPLDAGLLKLFKYWFNPSFLVLEKIDWSTPANVLEKIIEYEAVHEINSWKDLRSRLAPNDRQCFAFFHPLVPEDPLIFVEVALTKEIPTSIQILNKFSLTSTLLTLTTWLLNRVSCIKNYCHFSLRIQKDTSVVIKTNVRSIRTTHLFHSAHHDCSRNTSFFDISVWRCFFYGNHDLIPN